MYLVTLGVLGFLSVFLAPLTGAVTLIPGLVAFPVARQLIENGAAVLPIAAFISSLMMVGIITLAMEIHYLGKRIAFLRNALALRFALLAAYLVSWGVSLWQ
ncbi:MAG: hypothetical protein GW949_08525 [Spirochaetales bacterium]|nr:hypothetical protein [Spirochaetales bacterium]